MRPLLIAVIALTGAGMSVQAAVNARLRLAVGSPVLSALISFLGGIVLLAALAAFRVFGPNKFSGLATAPWWSYLGGLFGAAIVTAAVIGVPRIGTGGVIAATVFGQLVMALVMDSCGMFGVARIPMSPARLAAAALLFAGVLLMQKK